MNFHQNKMNICLFEFIMALKELPVGQIGIETLVMRTLEVKYTLNIYNKKIIYLPWWGVPIGVIVSLFCALITIAIVSTIIFLSRRSCSLAISVVEVLEEIWTNLFWCYSFILHQLYIDLLFVSCNHWFVEQFYQKEIWCCLMIVDKRQPTQLTKVDYKILTCS